MHNFQHSLQMGKASVMVVMVSGVGFSATVIEDSFLCNTGVITINAIVQLMFTINGLLNAVLFRSELGSMFLIEFVDNFVNVANFTEFIAALVKLLHFSAVLFICSFIFIVYLFFLCNLFSIAIFYFISFFYDFFCFIYSCRTTRDRLTDRNLDPPAPLPATLNSFTTSKFSLILFLGSPVRAVALLLFILLF